MSGRARLYVADMLSYAKMALSFVAGRKEEDLTDDEMLRLAVVHAIQTIGEAAKSVPEDVRNLQPDIPWPQVARTRDIIVHHYFGVKLDVVWQVTQVDLPTMIPQLESLLVKMDELPES
jgi:uncharacterized protein with HEPN domain